jgi:cell wall-associated NlpC family hydrolase
VTRTEVVERARRCIGQSCVYRLGRGGFHPNDKWPWESMTLPSCDCSGFVAWCLGVSRKTDNPFYREQNGGWFETTVLARDARSPYGFVEMIPREVALIGDLLVYGDAKGKQGHVGIVSEVNADGPMKAIHCSLGNYKRSGDAVQETGVLAWERPDALVARVAWVNG